MGITLANNARTTLTANISSTDTTIYVDDVSSFPALDVGDYFYCTLETTTGTVEIVKVTQINTASFNVVRGQEGTIAVPFNIGARVELRVTVQALEDLLESNVSDEPYGSSWNADTSTAPSRNAVYDKLTSVDAAVIAAVSDTAYAGNWNGVTDVAPSKNAVYDKIESILDGQTFTGTVAITPTAASSTMGIDIDQSGPTTGSVASEFYYNDILVNGDNATCANTAYALAVRYGVGGSNLTGQRTALRGFLVFNTASSASNPYKIYAGLSGEIQASAGDGGTNTGAGALGRFLGGYSSAIATSGATNLYDLTGHEVNVGYRTGSSGKDLISLKIAPWADHAVEPANLSAAIQIAVQNGGLPHKYGVTFDGSSTGVGTNPIAATGTLIETRGSFTVAKGVDLSSATFSDYAFVSPGFAVSPIGSVTTAGQFRVATTGPALIFDETDADANTRKWGLLAQSNEFHIHTYTDDEATAANVLTLTRSAATPTFVRVHVPLVPDSNDLCALGASSLSFSDLFLASGGVINWNNGNYTATHSSGLLTLSGALSLGTSNAFTTGTIELGAASDTTLARIAAGRVSIEGNEIATIAQAKTWTAAQTFDAGIALNQSDNIIWVSTSGDQIRVSNDGTNFVWNRHNNSGTYQSSPVYLSLADDILHTSGLAAAAITATSLSATGGITAYNATAIPAGGTTSSGYKFSSTSNFGVFFGSGTPSLSAAQGSQYLRSDGAAYTGAGVYVNTSGSTTWRSIGVSAIQPLFVLYADMNSTSDQTFTKVGTFDEYVITSISGLDGTASAASAVGGIYTGAGGTGDTLVTSFTWSAFNAANVGQGLTITAGANSARVRRSQTPILKLSTPQGSASSLRIIVYGSILN